VDWFIHSYRLQSPCHGIADQVDLTHARCDEKMPQANVDNSSLVPRLLSERSKPTSRVRFGGDATETLIFNDAGLCYLHKAKQTPSPSLQYLPKPSSLPSLSHAHIFLDTSFASKTISYPLLISSTMADTVAGGPTLDHAATATGSNFPPSSTALRTAESSKSDELADLIARATAAYAIKDYSPAAELYSKATELQAKINGEMAIENADLLYSYGKCLYFVAVSNSDVLGGTAAGAKIGTSHPEKKVTKKRKLNGAASTSTATPSKNEESEVAAPESLADVVANGAADVIPEADLEPEPAADTEQDGSKPYFQFTGDDKGWGNSDEEGDDDDDGDDDEEGAATEPTAANGAEEEDQEEEDDFVTAYEILDFARVLFLRKLEASQQSAPEDSSKGKYVASIDRTPEVREIKERLADVHDLQAEISLEGEKFPSAVTELQASLALKEELYPVESSVLAECYYKLSLALEFSATKQNFDVNGNPVGEATVDEEMRAQAAEQMEKAIASCKLRIDKESAAVEQSSAEDDLPTTEKKRKNIEDVREMVADMEQRLVELRKPPVSVKEAEKAEENNALSGILGQILGGEKSKEEKQKMLEEAAMGAKDLSGLVKRKKAKGTESVTEGSASATPEPSTMGLNENGKRKVEFADEVEEMGPGKKARVEDADDVP
jgi:HAT1-interacting factor 1